MNGNVHAAIGFGSLTLFCLQNPLGLILPSTNIKVIPAIGLATVILGSYMPDIDMQTTHMGHQHKTASKMINKVGGGHRGITHTLLVPTLCVIAMYFADALLNQYKFINIGLQSVIFGFVYGYIAHIIADMFNGKGTPILWPISRNKISVMDLPSTGIIPWIFTVIVLVTQAGIMFGGQFLC